MPQIETTRRISFDFETHPIALANVLPEPVVAALYDGNETEVLSTADFDCPVDQGRLLLVNGIGAFLTDPSVLLINHHVSFDLGVMGYMDPSLIPSIFKALCDEPHVHCTQIREKLLRLTDTGDLEYMEMGEGGRMKMEYGLAALMKIRFQKDRSTEKEDPASWRTHFGQLEGMRSQDYPAEALAYVSEDAGDAMALWQDQERRREDLISSMGVDPFVQLDLNVAADFCMTLISAWGCAVDGVEVKRLQDWLEIELAPERVNLLIEHGFIIPAQPARPHKNGACNPDGTPKMTAAVKESCSHKTVRAYITALAEANPAVEVWMTDPSDRFPQGQISFSSEWLEEFAHFDPVLMQFEHRAKLLKLRDTDVPRMMLKDAKGEATTTPSPFVHPNFDPLKETGRTSSFGGSLYPSFNCQNVHPKARGCIVPRPGYLLLSIDYQQLELATWAQQLFRLFGTSRLRDMINAGYDLHAYLAAQIAIRMSPEFAEACSKSGADNHDLQYQAFKSLEKHASQDMRDFYDKYRGLAKPTGLGYPGGLGAQTMITYAKGTYNTIIDLETAKLLRQVWFDTLPEAKPYFDWITKACRDQRNGPKVYMKKNPKTGLLEKDEKDLYAYRTQLGLYRSGCDFCAACNGFGLQSPAAEGFKIAIIQTTRACYDRSQSSILFDDELGPRVRPLMPIHDELVFEIRNEPENYQAWIREAQRLMEESMKIVCPDVTIRTDACLMSRWDGKAKPVRDAEGNLQVWKPKEIK